MIQSKPPGKHEYGDRSSNMHTFNTFEDLISVPIVAKTLHCLFLSAPGLARLHHTWWQLIESRSILPRMKKASIEENNNGETSSQEDVFDESPIKGKAAAAAALQDSEGASMDGCSESEIANNGWHSPLPSTTLLASLSANGNRAAAFTPSMRYSKQIRQDNNDVHRGSPANSGILPTLSSIRDCPVATPLKPSVDFSCCPSINAPSVIIHNMKHNHRYCSSPVNSLVGRPSPPSSSSSNSRNNNTAAADIIEALTYAEDDNLSGRVSPVKLPCKRRRNPAEGLYKECSSVEDVEGFNYCCYDKFEKQSSPSFCYEQGVHRCNRQKAHRNEYVKLQVDRSTAASRRRNEEIFKQYYGLLLKKKRCVTGRVGLRFRREVRARSVPTAMRDRPGKRQIIDENQLQDLPVLVRSMRKKLNLRKGERRIKSLLPLHVQKRSAF